MNPEQFIKDIETRIHMMACIPQIREEDVDAIMNNCEMLRHFVQEAMDYRG